MEQGGVDGFVEAATDPRRKGQLRRNGWNYVLGGRFVVGQLTLSAGCSASRAVTGVVRIAVRRERWEKF